MLRELLLVALNLLHHLVLKATFVRSALVDAISIGKLDEIVFGLMLQRSAKVIVRELLTVAHATEMRIE